MMRDTLPLEFRVLSGRHAGAGAAAHDGLLIGSGEDADVILTDLSSDAGLGRLHLLDGERWLLTTADAELDDNARAQALNVGEACYWGGLALCVSTPHAEWPAAPPVPPVSIPGKLPETASKEDTAEAEGAEDAEKSEASLSPGQDVMEASGQEGHQGPRWAIGVAALVGFLVIVLALLAWGRMHGESVAPVGQTPAPEADLTAQAQRQVPDLALTVAQVDPALRMELTPQRDGRVQVSGWVDSVAQFDRLADALGTRRPPPQLRVFVVSDVQAEIKAQLAGRYSTLDFLPGGPGVLRVRGVMLNEAEEGETLAAIRPLVPGGMELVGELRQAEKFVPDVQSALTSGGFDHVRVRWDGNRIVATLSLSEGDRARLESKLVALNERFPGLPLSVVPELQSAALQTARANPPFPIRSVVGGDTPYIVLPGGGKLLSGGTHAGWRLQSIEADALIFDAPRRLVVAR